MFVVQPDSGRGRPISRRKITSEGLKAFFRDIHTQHSLDELTFVCIGTDRSTGDALGPLVGTMLMEYGFPSVIGTMESPCDADNLERYVHGIQKSHKVIAIDACLGHPGTTGSFLVSEEPVVPAEAIGLELPAVGDYSIAGIVNTRSPKPYWTLQMTSLHFVMNMAAQIANAASASFGLWQPSDGAKTGYRFR